MIIKDSLLPDSQYYKEETKKTMIFLHHTVSPGNDQRGDINWWLNTPEKVATHCIITQDGVIWKTIDSKYWGHHLGLHTANNTALNRTSYAIELDSLGPVDRNGISIAYPKLSTKIGIQKYPNKFRGYQYFEKYTTDQIQAAKELIIAMCAKFNIPMAYNSDMWDVSNKALTGQPGIWSHISVRADKSDCHPQPELIEMLKSLSKV